MTDRELLERAAKAAGIDVICGHDELGLYPGGMVGPWNPLTDDGDAFRLAVKLGMIVEVNIGRLEPFTRVSVEPFGDFEEEHRGHAEHATRRCIVRAAAAMAPTGEKP
jgi:hypothetical protein